MNIPSSFLSFLRPRLSRYPPVFFFGLLLLAPFSCGCEIFTEYGRILYENERTVTVGQEFRDKNGLYAVSVPSDDLYFIRDAHGLVLIPKGFGKFGSGNYFVYTFPQAKMPQDAWGDYQKSFEWINQNFIRKRARGYKVSVLKTEPRVFNNEQAVYFEFFLPEMVKRGFGGITVLNRYAYNYASILLFHRGHLYWIYHSNPIVSVQYSYLDKVSPQMENRTREEFEAFLPGVKIDPGPAKKR